MDIINKLSRFMRNSGPARVLVPIGIVLIIFGVITCSFGSRDMVETTGKVTGVREAGEEDGKKVFDVDVSYNADGREYANTFYNMSGDYSVGDDIRIFYDAADPNTISNSGMNGLIGLGLIAAGIAAAVAGILKTVRAFRKSRELDQAAGGKSAPAVEFGDFKNAEGVRELYCRYDGNTFKPGYILEDADGTVLFEGKMEKNNLIGARVFRFTDHTTGSVSEHEVGHELSESYNNEFLSNRSWFKFDGKNIWDIIHDRGLRISTNLFSKFPNLIYEVSQNGSPFARIETSSMYVHEEEEAQHKIAIPVGKYYYRIWTGSRDLETVFLTVFGISESEQAIVE